MPFVGFPQPQLSTQRGGTVLCRGAAGWCWWLPGDIPGVQTSQPLSNWVGFMQRDLAEVKASRRGAVFPWGETLVQERLEEGTAVPPLSFLIFPRAQSAEIGRSIQRQDFCPLLLNVSRENPWARAVHGAPAAGALPEFPRAGGGCWKTNKPGLAHPVPCPQD